MAFLTKDIDRKEKEGKLLAAPVGAGIKIFNGALVKHNASGYLARAAAEAGAAFAGVSYERVDNTDGSDGDKTCRALKKGAFLMDGTGFAQSNVGDVVYAKDDNIVGLTDAGNEQAVGKIVEFISATKVRVLIDGYAV